MPFSQQIDSRRLRSPLANGAAEPCNVPHEHVLQHARTTEAGSAVFNEADYRPGEGVGRHITPQSGCLPNQSGYSCEKASALKRDLVIHDQQARADCLTPMPAPSVPIIRRDSNRTYDGRECPTTPDDPRSMTVDCDGRSIAVRSEQGHEGSQGQQARQAHVCDAMTPAESGCRVLPENRYGVEPLYAGVFLKEGVAMSLRNRYVSSHCSNGANPLPFDFICFSHCDHPYQCAHALYATCRRATGV